MELSAANWTHCSFSNQNLKALVTFGAEPGSDENVFVYYATVLDQENNEIFQREFPSLEAACDYLNQKYKGLWQWQDALRSKKEGGCSTCIAH